MLSVLSVCVGGSIALFTVSYYRGAADMQIRAVAESGGGHLRLVPEGWRETRRDTLRLADADRALREARSLDPVEAAVPRARSNGLLAFGSRSVGARLTGVEPALEFKTNRMVYKSKLTGRYLEAGDMSSIVVGRAVAERLDVGLDDELMLTVSGRQEIRGAMLRLVGILDSGSSDLDLGICHVTLDKLAELTDYENPGEITILLKDSLSIESTQATLASALPSGIDVLTWKAVNPGIAANVEGDGAFIKLLNLIIALVVVLGVTSAQLTSFLERRQEFGVLTALGMKRRQLAILVLLEGVFVGVVGGALIALVGGSAAYLLATRGINFEALAGEGIAVGNILFEPIIYGDFGPWIVPRAFTLALVATALASIYPAWHAFRIRPVEEMRIE